MKLLDFRALTVVQRALMVGLALTGAALVYGSTYRHGAGLSADSADYVCAARQIMSGAGVVTMVGGEPLVSQPPLYPATMALVGWVVGQDPLLIARALNAALFGASICLGGTLALRLLSKRPWLALLGTAAIAFSPSLFDASVMALSESLFTVLTLVGLLFMARYLDDPTWASLLLLSLAVALACLTQYIGVVLIFWGLLAIAVLGPRIYREKAQQLVVFALCSALPLSVWLLRNLAVSGTLFGPRAASTLTFSQNMALAFGVLFRWYVPPGVDLHRSVLLLMGGVVGFFAGLSWKDGRRWSHASVVRLAPVALFVALYLGFLTMTSTATAYERIGPRLVSPVYVPLTLLLFVAVDTITSPRQAFGRPAIVKALVTAGAAVWLLYPLSVTLASAATVAESGREYASVSWRTSDTIQELLRRRLELDPCAVYTNGPDVAYLLAGAEARMSPRRIPQDCNVPLSADDLKGTWPEETAACLIWFDAIERAYLFTPDQLQEIAELTEIVRLKDGTLYAVTRR